MTHSPVQERWRRAEAGSESFFLSNKSFDHLMPVYVPAVA
jgi:hypothetical protein